MLSLGRNFFYLIFWAFVNKISFFVSCYFWKYEQINSLTIKFRQ
ncbi:hypothetical protein CMALT394_980003 [Carnobacterium maltaromaticum]|nr:hypothetical protein CMALT394_980003 [Carnobacterium maltaromaticum]